MKTVKIALTKTVSEDGIRVRRPTGIELEVPIYSFAELASHSAEAAAWAEAAIEAACLAKARNAGTKDAVHSSIDDLISKAERSFEALKLHAAFSQSFAAYLAKFAADKKQAVRDTLVAMARNKNILATSNEVRKTALEGLIANATKEQTT